MKMDKNDIISKTINYVQGELENEASGHDWHHVRRVWINAKKLANEENIDSFIIELAALLHDIDDWKVTGKKPGDESEKVKCFLITLDIPIEIVTKVINIIKSIDYRGSIEKTLASTIEAKIVYDADKLDAIGAIGIARCFSFGGNKKTQIFDPNKFPILDIDQKQYVDIHRKTNTGINHFFEKLLRLKERFHTKSAQNESEKRHQFMIDYLSQFFDEQNVPEWKTYLDNFLINQSTKSSSTRY